MTPLLETDPPPGPTAEPNTAAAIDHYPVVIVGGGPTGLTLACLLSRYGTRALLVERNASTVQEPRAVSIDDESLRTMQAAGAIAAVLPDVVEGYGSEYLSPRGRAFMKVAPADRPYGYARRNAFRQPRLEATLRRTLAASATVDTLFGHALDRFEADADGVTLTLQGADGTPRTIRTDYLVAADGGRSPIRTTLGLTLDGETFEERWLIVDLEDSPASSAETIVFCDARRPCIALPGPNATRRFEFKLLPGERPEDMTDEALVRGLIGARGAHPGSRIVRRVVYTFHARVAPRWRQGRVFLAGDACHLTPPFAGQGMNSCIRDAHNLAWKLAWVTAGRLPPAILDSYEPERREHVAEMIRLALRMGRIMGPANRWRGAMTRGFFHMLGLWAPARSYFAQMKYKPKPRFRRGLVVPDGRPSRVTLCGRLLPQPSVVRHDGTAVLLDDLLGDGFALIGLGVDADVLVRVAGHPALAGLRPTLVRIGAPATTSADGEGAPVSALDPAGTLAAAAGGTDRILLVRPDRYVVTTFHPGQIGVVAQSLATLLPVLGMQVAH